VRAGDSLWLIARARLTDASGRAPGETEVANYWRAVIAANRPTLRSGDPSLIYPGEILVLPPVSAVS
jgi:nucleoid-associated protein YgaU